MREFHLTPEPDDPRLSETVSGLDQDGNRIETAVVTERPLTLFLNAREIVTMMTIGDHPDLLAVGYLLNQNMLRLDDEITGIDYEDDIGVVVVRTKRETDYEEKLKKRIQTSGCAQGTVFGDVMENFDGTHLPADAEVRTSWIYTLSQDQSGPEPLSEGRRDPRQRALRKGPPTGLYGGCRPPQRRRQDCWLHVPKSYSGRR